MEKEWLWGAGTSAFQIEGAWDEDGKLNSIWDEWNHKENKISDGTNADVACDHYHQWQSDIEHLKNLGVNSYRFSIAWTRIHPTGKKSSLNQKGIDFYSNLIDGLLAANIQPFVTLYHWDLPQALQNEYQGWLSPNIVEDFVDFAQVCFQHFGDRVHHWTTFNEPYCVVHYGHGVGDSPPGIKSEESAYLAAHHILLAHAKTYELFSRDFNSSKKSQLGIVLNSGWYEPFPEDGQSASEQNVRASERILEFKFGWFAQPLFSGEYPESMRSAIPFLPRFSESESDLLKNSADFLGINHYGTKYYQHNDDPEKGSYWEKFARVSCVSYNPGLNTNALGWMYADWGLRKLLNAVQKSYPLPLYVTENGFASQDTDGYDVFNDFHRVEYLKGFLNQLPKILSDGVDLRGYFVWSLLDNFEWNEGYRPRFGIIHVDFDSPSKDRKWKASANFYKHWISTHPPKMLTQ